MTVYGGRHCESPQVVAFGEPMFELNASNPGIFGEVTGFAPGFGGDTSNFAVAVARLGGHVGYICGLGHDAPGEALLALWCAEGVDVSRVKVLSDRPTGIYFIMHDPDGNHTFAYVRRGSAASQFGPEMMDLDYIRGAKVFHFSGITQAISQRARAAVLVAREAAREAGALISYDPNLRIALWPLEQARETILETVRHVDIVLPSLDEARLLTGLEDPHQIVRTLRKMGPKIVALKLGSDGCIIADHEAEPIHVPAWPVKVKDTAGAGDAFAGAIVVGYLQGWPLWRMGRFANAAGALTAAGVGCVTPIPLPDDVEKLMSRTERSAVRLEVSGNGTR